MYLDEKSQHTPRTLEFTNPLKPEVIIDIAAHHFIRLDDLLYFMIDEKVERVDMLLYQTLNFQKRWQKVPFVLQRGQPVLQHDDSI